MVDLFSQLGVEVIDCDQKPFDPEFHDAMLRELNNDLPDGTVLQELRKGFTIRGRLLRPAMVKVRSHSALFFSRNTSVSVCQVSYSDEVLQDTGLPMDEEEEEEAVEQEVESTLELDKEESENASELSD